jgi:thiol-disulfide isomerase/thioredoxin
MQPYRMGFANFAAAAALGLSALLGSQTAFAEEASKPAAGPDAPTPETGKLELGSIEATLRGLHLRDLEDHTVNLGDALGKGPILIDFWATWCKPCLASLPEIDKIYADLHPRGLQMFAINEDGPRNAAKVKPFMQSQGFHMPVVLDLNREAQSRLNALMLPTTLLVDAKGRVIQSSIGFRPGENAKLRLKIESLLPGKAHD